ncbi:hypothetical protein [Gryllotalpicola koreensis]|uniref:DUF222 domain-containing protein n=1 Tax=Gryllotalpicola koreensis TaxID=993086 RepID=A0ABP7ZWB5_9MICO
MALTLCEFGHVATTAQLVASVHGQHSVVDVYQLSRDIVRVRRGLQACNHLTEDELDALRVGGLLDCVSLLRIHGIDAPQDGRLHVRVPRHAGRTLAAVADGREVARHWAPLRWPLPSRAAAARAVHDHKPVPSRAQVMLADALEQARLCTGLELRVPHSPNGGSLST